MIDRAARDCLLDAIRRFIAGEIDNFSFDELAGSIRTVDRGVTEIRAAMWHLYDDLTRHRLTGSWTLSPSQEEAIGRCRLFLDSNIDYGWPKHRFTHPLLRVAIGFFTLGLVPRYLDKKRKAAGAWDAWPFVSEAELSDARRALSSPRPGISRR